jgi:hypothetical protein
MMDETERLARLMAARYGDPDALVYRGGLQRFEIGYVLPKPSDSGICPYWHRFLGAAQVAVEDRKKAEDMKRAD